MSMKKWSILVASGMIAAFSLGFQGPVSAASMGPTAHPTGCTYQSNNDNGAMARCSKSNGGRYKATVMCTRLDGGGLVNIDAVAWRTSGWSNVYCPTLTQFSSAGIITQG
ncbi:MULTISPECIES: hypothetical protein [Streptomyces]|uniref:hypothetical protein n=1 Tax=Streptomyces TaxID=1883 RepID=UPI002F4014EE